MKKLMLMVVAIVVANVSFAQNVNVSVSGSAMYSSKNASVGTGLVFSEDPAVICQMNTSVSYDDWAVSAYYSGYTGIQRLNVGDQYHLVDVLASYNVNDNLTLYVGPEFTYKDSENDATGSGVIAMMTWSKNKVDATGIYYTDPAFTIHYFIGSVNVQITENFSTYGLVGVTTAEPTPVYGMFGAKYSKNAAFIGAYYTFRDNAPGPHFTAGFRF